MIQGKIATAGLMALSLTLFACGKTNNSSIADNANEFSKDPSLQGKVFKGDCSTAPIDQVAVGIPTGGDNAIKSARIQYGFAGASMTQDTMLYKTSDCSGLASISFAETGSFLLDTSKKTAEGAKQIDISSQNLNLLVGDETGVLIAKAISLCGTADWSVGQKRDVTTAAAAPNCYKRALPSHDSTIYMLDGKVLYFGQKKPMERNPTRPDTLDRSLKFAAD